MRVFSSFDAVVVDRPQVVTIGAFDGVHRGHRYLIERAATLAQTHAAGVTAVTFWPPPAVVLEPTKLVQCLTVQDEKIAALAQTQHVDQIVVLPFTRDLAQLTATDFLARLRAYIDVVAFVEGDDFKLGHNREGTLAWLQSYGAAQHIVVEAVARRVDDNMPISSSRIRQLLAAGDVSAANVLLGRPYQIAGMVVHGDARGRTLGYPTANLRVDPLKFIPANGIYAAHAWRADAPAVMWQSAVSIGTRPVFAGKERTIEAYLLDVHVDLYDTTLRIALRERLREEQNFASVEALVAQMDRDVAATRRRLDDGEIGGAL